MVDGQAGKGSKRRPTNEEQYRKNYEKCFGVNTKKKTSNKKEKDGKKKK
jgi:hypothetical protein